MENAVVGIFNGRLRDERPNEHSFPTIFHARSAIEAWRFDYNQRQPHTTLNGMTPVEFIKSYLNQNSHFTPTDIIGAASGIDIVGRSMET